MPIKMQSDDIMAIFDNLNIEMPNSILTDIMFYLKGTKHANNHLSFIVDTKTMSIKTYQFNKFYLSDKFPYSSHSEAEAINKFLKMNINTKKSKNMFINIKISKIGKIGNSRPCKSCARNLYNNYNALNLNKILYSVDNTEMKKLNKINLLDEHFKTSAGFDIKKRFQSVN